MSQYSQKVAELDELENLGHKYGFMSGPKRRGRKPLA
jgi:hypothetical protein